MLITVLGSGSSGNATIVSSGKTTILIDAGFSAKTIQKRLQQIHFPLSQINAIIISHEHYDHSKGWKSCAKCFDAPVYMTEGASQLLQSEGKKNSVTIFQTGRQFQIGDFTICPFPVPHDSSDPTAFIIENKKYSIGIATDLGYLPNLVKNYLNKCNMLILESNHDPDMLKNGPYPWPLKQRIMSRLGHLSNDTVRIFISEYIDEKCFYLFLAHLSRQNNSPELALSTSLAALGSNKVTKLLTTHQSNPTEIIEL
ncbi:MAG: hypothetical protein A2Y62_05635 [Candidatus Fischerbacteria bacterium RBG_13_37_8]|uniref:Metallo-beta-lactamase domain-containing protein n=1 Tax=Candidatus Fischerbacteria bacterium RBG_13_37_8 TaxID=1817863 RepID=A0A1F5VXC2_9BACT|nr:MAG: hypothetical protein A2Y62_05635 [Candidatus Fischerbacteria bacterium RBG_13_37_8]